MSQGDQTQGEVMAADYVVIGAGASGMSFADVILTESNFTIAIVDAHAQPGGHWNHAYSFVRLHQPSAFYGVTSRMLGSLERDVEGTNAGYYELATGQQVITYFDEVMREQFLPSGRVTYLPMSEYQPDGTVVSALTGRHTKLIARRRVVDARYLGSVVPSTHTPSFKIADDVAFIPVNGLTSLSAAHPEYVILGAGKTSVDATLWLLDHGVDPKRITWVRPHDVWFYDRSCLQPGRSILAFAADLYDAASKTDGPDDYLARLEAADVLVRIDPNVWPTKFRGATVSRAEIVQACRVERVVRGGRVVQLQPGVIKLEDGSEHRVDPAALFVDCTAEGLRYRPPVPIFERDRITLQFAQFSGHPTYSAALIARLELAPDDDTVKNEACPPNCMSGEARTFAAQVLTSLESLPKMNAIDGFAQWNGTARLNGLSWALNPATLEDPQAQADLTRLLTMAEPALQNLRAVVGGPVAT